MTRTAEPHVHEHAHEHAHGDEVAHAHVHLHPHAPEELHAEPEAHAPVDPAIAARWVDVEHVHFSYPDGFEALRGVSLRLARGEKVALVGPNGAGKSTLLLALNGIHLPSHGTVSIAGSQVDRRTVKRIRAEVGLVFQDPDD